MKKSFFHQDILNLILDFCCYIDDDDSKVSLTMKINPSGNFGKFFHITRTIHGGKPYNVGILTKKRWFVVRPAITYFYHYCRRFLMMNPRERLRSNLLCNYNDGYRRDTFIPPQYGEIIKLCNDMTHSFENTVLSYQLTFDRRRFR